MDTYYPLALRQAQLSRGRCLELLKGVPDTCRNGNLIELENFVCQVNNDGCLDFWRKGQKETKSSRLTSPNNSADISTSLCVFMPGHRIILGDFAGINIQEHFNEDNGYPHTEFKWSGQLSGNYKIGELHLARVDLSGQSFVIYQIYSNFKGRENGRHDIVLDPSVAPLSISDGEKFFGVTVKMNIDFGARANEIQEISELTDFASECEIFSV